MSFVVIVLGFVVASLIVDFVFFREEIRCAIDRDPATCNPWSVVFFSPGFLAIKSHRMAHWFHMQRIPLLPTIISNWVRFWTGIEIHPGAQIGRGLFIDHGMGVVIGETTIIQENVTLYQQVTLGGTGKEKGKRHPTLGNNVVVGAGAKVLGNIIVGDNVFVGANAVVVNDVPDSSTVVGVPGRIAKREGKRLPGVTLDHTHLPDPITKSLQNLQDEINKIEKELKDHQED